MIRLNNYIVMLMFVQGCPIELAIKMCEYKVIFTSHVIKLKIAIKQLTIFYYLHYWKILTKIVVINE